MIIKEYQEFKPVQRALGLKADGLPGPKTLAAVALKLRCHEIWSAVQAAVNVTPDGHPRPCHGPRHCRRPGHCPAPVLA